MQAGLKGEYNRVFKFHGDINAVGRIELNKRLSFKSGFSLEFEQNITKISTFANGSFGILKSKPLGTALSYIYNGQPQYSINRHSILPFIFWHDKYWGIAIGCSFRLNSFFGEKPIFEPAFSYYVYGNFINNETLRIGVRVANFGDFYAENLSSYSLCFYSDIRLNSLLSLINEIELLQSGSIALAANFYGIALRAGVKFTW